MWSLSQFNDKYAMSLCAIDGKKIVQISWRGHKYERHFLQQKENQKMMV